MSVNRYEDRTRKTFRCCLFVSTTSILPAEVAEVSWVLCHALIENMTLRCATQGPPVSLCRVYYNYHHHHYYLQSYTVSEMCEVPSKVGFRIHCAPTRILYMVSCHMLECRYRKTHPHVNGITHLLGEPSPASRRRIGLLCRQASWTSIAF